MRWRIEQDGTTWRVVRPDGSELSNGHASYQLAMQALPGRAAVLAMATELAPIPPADGAPPAEGDAAPEVTPPGEAPPPDPAAAADLAVESGPRSWTADAGFTGQWTGDGRYIEADGCTFRPFPQPLMLQTETEIGHFGAELAGWVTSGVVQPDGAIRLTGEFDGSDEGDQALAIVGERGWFGVSLDGGACTVESECVAMDDDGWCAEWRDRFVESEWIGLTMTPFPAFQNARLWLTLAGDPEPLPVPAYATDSRPAITPEGSDGMMPGLLIASAGPERPPADWFADPGIGDIDHPLMTFGTCGQTGELVPTGVPLQVTDDGRIFGHLAAWGTCHVGLPDCTTPPPSPSQYAYFRTGYVVADDGAQVPTGVITMGTGHAGTHLSARDATAHYDDARFGVADVASGEDAVGIWVAGSMRSTATPEQVQALRALSLSGDWRTIGGHLELVAALAVNVPGFPIPRTLTASVRASIPEARRTYRQGTGGQVLALVASGIVPRQEDGQGQDARWKADVERRLALLDGRTAPLVASAQAALVGRVRR